MMSIISPGPVKKNIFKNICFTVYCFRARASRIKSCKSKFITLRWSQIYLIPAIFLQFMYELRKLYSVEFKDRISVPCVVSCMGERCHLCLRLSRRDNVYNIRANQIIEVLDRENIQ